MDAIWVILLGVLGFLVGFFAGFSICVIVMVRPLKKNNFPMVVCDFDGRTAVGAYFDYGSTGDVEQDVGFKPDILIVRRSKQS